MKTSAAIRNQIWPVLYAFAVYEWKEEDLYIQMQQRWSILSS